VLLGSSTKVSDDDDQNEIVIGYNATGIGNNTVTLGNDDITKTYLKGNVGIGTSTPATKLEVNGYVISSNIDTLNTPTFTTDIEYGVGSRILVQPAGYWVEAIKIVDLGTGPGLSSIRCVQETSGIFLIENKDVAHTTTKVFTTINDHEVYGTNKNLTFTATGNGGSGMQIIVYLRQ
jgi:hypothetical protein